MQQITDYTGKVIALMENNQWQEKIYTPIGYYLGYYDKALDKTYSSSGKYIGPGNHLMTLIY
jgi:hypothetical protein